MAAARLQTQEEFGFLGVIFDLCGLVLPSSRAHYYASTYSFTGARLPSAPEIVFSRILTSPLYASSTSTMYATLLIIPRTAGVSSSTRL